jgi:hypothetical protein
MAPARKAKGKAKQQDKQEEKQPAVPTQGTAAKLRHLVTEVV